MKSVHVFEKDLSNTPKYANQIQIQIFHLVVFQIQIQIQIFAYLNTNTNTNTYLTPALLVAQMVNKNLKAQKLRLRQHRSFMSIKSFEQTQQMRRVTR